MEEEDQRTLDIGQPSEIGTDNAIYTSRYNVFSFLPLAIGEQFRRNGNLYFLVMGLIMFIGWYTPFFSSSVSPWTTLGPLAVVISISLAQECAADLKRHNSDRETNNRPCVVVRRVADLPPGAKRDDTIDGGKDIEVVLRNVWKRKAPLKLNRSRSGGSRKSIGRGDAEFNHGEMDDDHGGRTVDKNVKVAFAKIKRMDIRAGDIVFVKNREMVPADIILLGSSGENGAAYIETSPIDGETNLKLRNSPHLPLDFTASVSTPRFSETSGEKYSHAKFETVEQTVKRLTRISLLGYPGGVSALKNPQNVQHGVDHILDVPPPPKNGRKTSFGSMRQSLSNVAQDENVIIDEKTKYVTTLTSEAPNVSVNTFSGKITLPPLGGCSASVDIPLNAENILLRGAVLRNTEWAIGVACFTGKDTKLAKNSVKTPSKFSRLDTLINRTVLLILTLMIASVAFLSIFGVSENSENFDELWYAGFNKEGEKWPYLPGLDAPEWKTEHEGYFYYVFTFITLLNNFVPLSLYVTVEGVILFMMYLISWDKEMYHEETDTPAVARSTNVTDLGQVKYVFSDKTGTLTQNVMNFKRCSVDGMVFGAPIEKSAPGDLGIEEGKESNEHLEAFHPLKKLLVGQVSLSGISEDDEESANEGASMVKSMDEPAESKGKLLTFNAEMFLRVMSICHTVVVEKEIDTSNINSNSDESVGPTPGIGLFFKRKNRSRNNTAGDLAAADDKKLDTVNENKPGGTDGEKQNSICSPTTNSEADNSYRTIESIINSKKSKDGSPDGNAYQAESPDEGALVSAASIEYGFQLVGRDSDGIKVSCASPSLLSVKEIVDGLRSRTLSPSDLAHETGAPSTGMNKSPLKRCLSRWEARHEQDFKGSIETWQLLAVNKFDSDRKRMSVVVRSPPSLGSIPILMCKGADSSMLDPEVCEGGRYMMSGEGLGASLSASASSESDDDVNGWQSSTLLGVQSHLGTFASEGLRTLVLGVRILTEEECEDWLMAYKHAAASITNRKKALKAVAKEIETKIHIVGATAIEDKLQDGVPDTIYNIGRAGIKLWVLTGDKRETAIEIGYSTKVLHPKMHVTDVADGAVKRVKALVAMEFIRLVKLGKLPQYQKSSYEATEKNTVFTIVIAFFKVVGSVLRMISRAYRRFYHSYIRTLGGFCFLEHSKAKLRAIDNEETEEKLDKYKFKQVRLLADELLDQYLESEDGQRELLKNKRSASVPIEIKDFDGGAELLPAVFNRANSARASLDLSASMVSEAALRSYSIAEMTANSAAAPDAPVVDEDARSMMSFVPGKDENVQKTFSRRKRTLLEKMFANDRDVRKGQLVKHLTKEKKREYYSDSNILPQNSEKDVPDWHNTNIDRALVIEGSALSHFLGNELLSELLFSVASNCDSVIACRVSPKQKAQLVSLVKQFVQPSPVTLAIGDGANDVGMIQEAQIGVGISGLEGQQAVNSSDFAIAQFRFLEELLLIHGRWNFMRMSKLVLFSFYKNAILAGLMMLYSRAAFYSGTPLFDQWVLSVFNFTCGWPIIFLGMFDRDLEKDYVKKNPHVYASGLNNEHMSVRTTLRWVALVLVHVNAIYYLCITTLEEGGSMTSAFKGLLSDESSYNPGDGEGGDLKIFGTTVFVILNWTLAIKVLYEDSSIVYGKMPAFTCRKDVGEGFWSRVGYTWVGVIYLSVAFNFFFLYTYQWLGYGEAMTAIGDGTNGNVEESKGLTVSTFFPFVMVSNHVFHMRSSTWIVIMLVTVTSTLLDVVGKVFGNMFYPTQTQIHREIQVLKPDAEPRMLTPSGEDIV